MRGCKQDETLRMRADRLMARECAGTLLQVRDRETRTLKKGHAVRTGVFKTVPQWEARVSSTWVPLRGGCAALLPLQQGKTKKVTWTICGGKVAFTAWRSGAKCIIERNPPWATQPCRILRCSRPAPDANGGRVLKKGHAVRTGVFKGVPRWEARVASVWTALRGGCAALLPLYQGKVRKVCWSIGNGEARVTAWRSANDAYYAMERHPSWPTQPRRFIRPTLVSKNTLS